MKSFTITKTELSDVPELKRIEIECGLSPWSIDAYESELERQDSLILKAQRMDGSVIGFILGRVPFDGGDAEIYNLGVATTLRREGIGSMLLKQFRNICVERRVADIWLEVRDSNVSAISFYRSHGFSKKGTRSNFYSNPTENAVLMLMSVV
ncbi:MAG: ribosomal protein S18-alanine N-acetyltransferase [Acidobacteriota bacterium]